MAPNAKRVFYVKYLSGPVFGEILAKRPDIQLDKLENESTDDVAGPVLAAASYAEALDLAATDAERRFLTRRLAETTAPE